MNIKYKNKRIKKICTEIRFAEKEYGSDMAEKIHQRIEEISAADSIEMMIWGRIGRCHALSQNRKGQYAVDLIQPFRLIFEKTEGIGICVKVIEIVDYH